MTGRVILVALDWIRPKDPRSTLGHASILARLRAEPGIEVVPMSCAVNAPTFDRGAVLVAILAALCAGTAIAIGVYVWNEPVVQWLLPALRQAGFTGRIVLGGPQITYASSGVLDLYPDADLAIRGAGEDALSSLLRGDDPARITGVVARGSTDVVTQAIADFSRLPSPILSLTLPVTPFVRWETHRGCVYRCNFCQHRAPANRRPQFLAQDRIGHEIDALVAGGATDVAVLDPIFHTNPNALLVLDRFASRGFRGRLSLQCRFEQVDEAFLEACANLTVRLEFGLQTSQPAEMRAIGRMNHLPKIERVIDQLRKRQIQFEVSLIYGLPEQTLASFRETVAWCLDRGVPTLRAFPLMLLRGTGLDHDRARWSLVEDDAVIPVVVESSTFTRADWTEMHMLAESLDAHVAVDL